ncbi:MAG: hypothetical protein FJY75_01325 [Candidatus Eisenbacteria bacterium]|uniref:FlgD/Vpr Ig-like domain-containing protein n=1 Tax=Eiseniibacteriota bacterium TaxID=2212470 RepID=A0A938BKX4_UNCEI|nr:hypothetical protein [Candidatus Eisenbacteria bacterium]
MRRGFALFAILCLVAVGSALARPAQTPDYQQMLLPGQHEDGFTPIRHEFTRVDTVWFGGDDGTGTALFSEDLANPDDAMWTWDHGGPDEFEGWYTQDMTTNDGVYFYRVTAASFAGDPCVPMFPGTTGQLWCGMHEADANDRDWVGGMGYGNNFCQRAMSPFLPCAGQKDVTVSWKMFQDSEVDYDYTYLYVLAYDSDVPPNLLTEVQVELYDGIIGSYAAPVTETKVMAAASIPAATTQVKVEFRFAADGGWSDEDGDYLTACGPFAADDVVVTVQGSSAVTYNFESGAQGWTFDACEGIGAYMAVWDEETWTEWVTTVNLPCGCTLSGNALGCVDTSTPFSVPGHKRDHQEQLTSGLCVLDRDAYPPEGYNTTIAQYNAYFYMRRAAGSFYRPGFKYYPFTSAVNPVPHMSQRLGQDVWYHTGITPFCTDGSITSLSANGMSTDWEQARFILEVITSCPQFGIPPAECRFEGQTFGAPLFDNVRVGVFGSVDAPSITLAVGHLFHDGFGQNFPTYLEPGDVGNSNVSYDYSRDDVDANDMHSDSAMIEGPMPTAARQWLCKLMVHVEKKGPRQDMIPGYHFWKSRLQGDPEAGWVGVLMDSAQISQSLVSAQAFSTYFHEDDPGFRGPRAQDYNELNEILPDLVFTPGTTIRYYYAPFWTDTPHITGFYGLRPDGWEYEILPGMRLQQGSEWDVEWPSVLYIDAFNRGSETYIVPTLAQLGLEYDKFDALDKGSNYDAPFKRSFRNGTWGNSGMTTQQALGYRLIIYNSGTFDVDSMEPPEFELFDEWLDATDCPEAAAVRRGLVLNGDQLMSIMDDPLGGIASDFANLKLGAQFVAESYRIYNNDQYNCIGTVASGSAVFTPAAPGASAFGNDCPTIFDFNVLGTHATGGTPSVGNLLWQSYNPGSTNPTVEFSQIVRAPAGTNWRSVVDAFSFHHVTQYGSPGNECQADSAKIVAGAANLLGPALTWIQDPSDPFVYWQYPCEDAAVDGNPDGHLAGQVNYLYQSRPNPFRSSATVRFNLAQAGRVDLSIYDVTGRLVRSLVNGERPAGENSVVWDGLDNGGSRVSGGIFWMQMNANGFSSSKKMVVLR